MNTLRTALISTLLLLSLPALAWGQPAGALPSDDQVRQLKLEALLAIGPVLLDPTASEADRLSVATVLVRTGDLSALPLLSLSLRDDPFASVRRAVAEGLGDLNAPEATLALRDAALAGSNASIRWASGVSLLQLDPSDREILDLLLNDPTTLAAAAVSLQDARAEAAFPQSLVGPVVDAFVAAFPDARTYDAVERAAMLKSLAAFDALDAAPLMFAALDDENEDPFVRGAAAFSLGQLGVKRAVPDLTAVLDGGLDALQVGALVALGNLADPSALEPVQTVLKTDGSDEIRATAATALGALGAPAVPALVAALNDDANPAVRQAAMTALKGIGGDEVADAVAAFATGGYLTTCDPQACSGLALETMSALATLGRGDLALQLLSAALDALASVLPFVYAFAEDDLVRVAVEVGRAEPSLFDELLANAQG